MKKKTVAVTRESATRVIRWFHTVRQAEQFIAGVERRNPGAVHAGEYGIDAPEQNERGRKSK